MKFGRITEFAEGKIPMRRHISIFAFLLGAFAATAQAASSTQRVEGGYYARERGKTVSQSSARMSVVGTGWHSIDLAEGDEATFRAFPERGFKVSQWGVLVNPESAQYAYQYDRYTWTNSTSETKVWRGKPADGNGYLAVNFDYIPFSIEFDKNGGEGKMEPITGLNIASNAIRLTSCTFTRTGYEMVGWSNAVYWAAQKKAIEDGATVKGEDFWDDAVTNFDGKLIALWKPNTYTVHFDGNGATDGSMVDQTFTYDEDAKELSANAFTNEKHVFAGWATNAVLGDVLYKDKEKVRNLTTNDNATVNLFARWTPMHKVTFRDSAMFEGKVLKEEFVEDGKDATPPDVPQHPGLSFKGWDGTYTRVTSDRTITAKYEGTEGAVWYYANDGTDGKTYQGFKHGVETTLLDANTFSRTGYTLDGWMKNAASTAADYACRAKFMIPLETDVFNLYAFWKPISYTVAFDGNGATEGSMEAIPLDYGALFKVPECGFKKTGCEFKSWQVLINKVVVTNYPAGVTVSNLTSKADGTVTFKADWIGRYTVAFNGNGGEGEMTNVMYETGVEYTLPSNVFTKTGYGFYGWAKSKADADALKKPAYTNGQTVVDLADPGETFTLFAEWKTNHYTVVFNPNGAGVKETMEPQNFFYDEAKPLSPNLFTRGELWSFAGWSNAVGRVFADGETVSNLCADDGGRVNLFARWTSERGPLSEAMGCDNLKWISDQAWDKSQRKDLDVWEVCTTNGFGGSCAQFVRAGLTLDLSTMHANIGTNGTLTFKWQPSGGSSRWLSVVVEGTKDPIEPYYFDAEDGGNWSDAKVTIPEFADGGTGVQIKIMSDGGICFVDQMTWVPEGAHPEPGPADAVKISTAAVSDGKFVLSFTSDARFDYNLLTNANLLINSWGVMANEKGTGETITFEPEINEDQPRLFYRVETIQRK